MADGGPASRDLKVVLLGDAGVGKSSLVLRFVTNTFDRYSEPTIGMALLACPALPVLGPLCVIPTPAVQRQLMSKLIAVDGQAIKFQIWDTAGQEKYHSLAPMYYRGAAAAIIVYDITREATFKTLQAWVRELQQLGPENIVIALCGNKADLEERREVRTDVARAYADEIGALFLETSAKANRNVQEVFVEIARRLPPPTDAGEIDDVADLRKPAGGKAGGGGGGRAGGGGGGGGGCC